jgi:hypothetical protein
MHYFTNIYKYGNYQLTAEQPGASGGASFLGSLLTLALDAGFLVVFATAQFSQDTVLLYLPVKSLQ